MEITKLFSICVHFYIILELNPVSNIRVTGGNFVWDKPDNVGVCEITYAIILNDENHLGYPINNFPLQNTYCRKNTISVTAKAENLESQILSHTYTVPRPESKYSKMSSNELESG